MDTRCALKGEKRVLGKYANIIKIQELFSCFPLTACSWPLSGYWEAERMACSFKQNPDVTRGLESALGPWKCALDLLWCLPSGQGEYAADLCSGISIAQWRQLFWSTYLGGLDKVPCVPVAAPEVLRVLGNACAHGVRHRASRHE